MEVIPSWAAWILYFLILFATLFVISNAWRMRKKPWLYRGDTGTPGICECKCCQGKPLLVEVPGGYRFESDSLDKPMTKEN